MKKVIIVAIKVAIGLVMLAGAHVVGIAVLLVLGFFIYCCGALFRANVPAFALLWVAAPLLACLLHRRTVAACFTLKGLRSVQGVLLAVVICISVAMFAHRDKLRNRFGERFIEGYQHWRAETEIDDEGREYYPGDEWEAKNLSGRWAVGLFGLGLLVAVIALPVVTWRASKSAIGAYLTGLDRYEVLNRLVALIANLLKWNYLAEQPPDSWLVAIHSQQRELREWQENSVIRSYSIQVFPQAYKEAIERAAAETGIKKTLFPSEPPCSLDELLFNAGELNSWARRANPT
jgi:hypothetical protein